MLGIKVASGFTAVSALLFSGYHYLTIKSGTIGNVLINEGYEFIDNLPKEMKRKSFEKAFKRNKVYIAARKNFLKGTTYELRDFEDDEEGGIALSYWCKEVTTKPVRANSSHHLMYAAQGCTLNFEDKLEADKLIGDNKTNPNAWQKKLAERTEIEELIGDDIEDKIINGCNSKRNTILNNLSRDDYEDAKIICANV